MAYASLVEFLLTWIEDAEVRGEDAEFGAVAAAIANVSRTARYANVVDVERMFPANAEGGGPPLTKLAEWSFSDYGQLIAARLQALYLRESEPKVLGNVMDAWGIAHDA
jgi:hypothetical protein